MKIHSLLLLALQPSASGGCVCLVLHAKFGVVFPSRPRNFFAVSLFVLEFCLLPREIYGFSLLHLFFAVPHRRHLLSDLLAHSRGCSEERERFRWFLSETGPFSRGVLGLFLRKTCNTGAALPRETLCVASVRFGCLSRLLCSLRLASAPAESVSLALCVLRLLFAFALRGNAHKDSVRNT